MKKLSTIVTIAIFAAMVCAGCSNRPHQQAHHADGKHEHEHKAAHGGSMNAIVTCENGHAEVQLDGDILRVWFVGGGSSTEKSVRIPDKAISLQVKTDKGTKTLVLNPRPLELAGEKVGDCSHFEGHADWLIGVKEFTANGQIKFKGARTPLKIEHPEGYDPD
jgi:hypothetical protein